MPRNFYRRVEVMFPVEQADLRDRILHEILPAYLKDNVKARILQPDCVFTRRPLAEGEIPYRVQERLLGLQPATAATSDSPLVSALNGNGAAAEAGLIDGGNAMPDALAANGNGEFGNGAPGHRELCNARRQRGRQSVGPAAWELSPPSLFLAAISNTFVLAPWNAARIETRANRRSSRPAGFRLPVCSSNLKRTGRWRD